MGGGEGREAPVVVIGGEAQTRPIRRRALDRIGDFIGDGVAPRRVAFAVERRRGG
jgi:hypothetical protein